LPHLWIAIFFAPIAAVITPTMLFASVAEASIGHVRARLEAFRTRRVVFKYRGADIPRRDIGKR
jgi:hypothetical protein